eukprot:m.370502 g.370502  ORF g.370502 m.370502 type:complete len:458 (+) comp20860_c0_seq3:33-1406(+)
MVLCGTETSVNPCSCCAMWLSAVSVSRCDCSWILSTTTCLSFVFIFFIDNAQFSFGSDLEKTTSSKNLCAHDEHAKFVAGKHEGHCLCLDGYTCVGSKCSAAHSSKHIGISGYKVGCIDCVCSSFSATTEDGSSFRDDTKNLSVTGEMVLVTAASANHVCPLLSLLHSISVQLAQTETLVIIYDLNPKPPYMRSEDLSKVYPNILVRRFPYEDYPSWFDVTVDAGQYAWKPVIIKTVVDEFGAALWVDSGNYFMKGLTVPMQQSEWMPPPSGFFSPTSNGHPWQWVHAGAFAYMGLKKCCDFRVSATRPCCCCDGTTGRGCSPSCPAVAPDRPNLTNAYPTLWMKKTMCNGALIGFSKTGTAYAQLLVPWFECSLDRRCIAPIYPDDSGRTSGSVSTRGNHRQDQAALTMLAIFSNNACSVHPRQLRIHMHKDGVNDNPLCRKIFGENHTLPKHIWQ